jgi:hypothetical protein
MHAKPLMGTAWAGGWRRERAGEHGHTDADALIRPQTPAEDRVLRYVTRKADGRPATAPGQWRRPHTVDGSPSRPVPSSPAAAARPGTAVSLSSLLPDQKVSVAVVGQAGVQERLRAALRAEHKALVQYAERIREWLDEEHEEAHEEAEAAAVEKPPALSDMRVYSGRLQEQYLCPDSLAAFFGPTDGARGAMLPAAAATAAVPAPAPAPASLVPAAALAPLAPPRRVAGGTPAAAAAVAAPFALGSQSAAAAAAAATMATTPAAAVGGAINHAAVGAAAGGRVARVARLRQQVGLAREMHSAEWAIK